MFFLNANTLILLVCLRTVSSFIENPTIVVLTDSQIYLMTVEEFNSTSDRSVSIFHRNQSFGIFQSLTSDENRQQIFFCSIEYLYRLNFSRNPLVSSISKVEGTPCRSNLKFFNKENLLLWSFGRSIVEWNLNDLHQPMLFWNSTSRISSFVFNRTANTDRTFTLYFALDQDQIQASILRCFSDRLDRFPLLTNCFTIADRFNQISSMFIDKNFLYVADQTARRIFVLNMTDGGFFFEKTFLPINDDFLGDINSMLVHENNLFWSTSNGHIRTIYLTNNRLRNIFQFDGQIQKIDLISFFQWPNQTTTTAKMNTTTHSNSQDQNSPWKISTYVLSAFLGFCLFISVVMITCVLITYRAEPTVPRSFTNIFHIFRSRMRNE